MPRRYLSLCLAAAVLTFTACGHLSAVAPSQSALPPAGEKGVYPPVSGASFGHTEDTWSDIHAFQVFDGGISKADATAHAHRYGFVWGTSKPEAWKAGNS